MKMSLGEIRKESRSLFDRQQSASSEISETSPGALSPSLIAFGDELSQSPLQIVPVVDDPDGIFGWCSDGVIEKVKKAGGRPVFGWCIWEWPHAFWTAEFHCVWQDTNGNLVDITPKPQGEKHIVLAPDYNFGPNFDFDNRPANARKRLRGQVDVSVVARDKVVRMSQSQLAYESGRAKKAGLSLEAWMQQKVPVDPLIEMVDEVIAATVLEEAERDRLGPGGGTFIATTRYLTAARRKAVALRTLKQAFRKLDVRVST